MQVGDGRVKNDALFIMIMSHLPHRIASENRLYAKINKVYIRRLL
jgi:hypothetical protein